MRVNHPFLKKIYCWILKLFDGSIVINVFSKTSKLSRIKYPCRFVIWIGWVPAQSGLQVSEGTSEKWYEIS